MVLKNAAPVALVLLVSAAATGHGQPAATTRVVHVVAERFAFTPSEITVEEGTTLELRISSDDTDHGFRLHGLGNPDVAIPKRGRGEVNVTIDAAQPGTYRFECSHLCGAGHGFMRGTIRVRPRAREDGR